jgi:hypothetical protein
MSWSTDGEWLAYTIVAGPARDDHVGPGWLFDTASGGSKTPGTREVGERKAADAQAAYQIWASHRNHGTSRCQALFLVFQLDSGPRSRSVRAERKQRTKPDTAKLFHRRYRPDDDLLPLVESL